MRHRGGALVAEFLGGVSALLNQLLPDARHARKVERLLELRKDKQRRRLLARRPQLNSLDIEKL